MSEAGESPVILVVDDDAALRDTVIGLLEPLGFTVVDAPNGRQALDILERDPTIRVLLADVMMPGISGVTLARKALELRPDLRVALISGYAGGGQPEEGLPVLRKPLRTEEIVRFVRLGPAAEGAAPATP